MVFSSILFLFYYLPLILVIYYVSPRRLKNFVLYVFSLIFYAWGEPVYVLIMIFSTITDYTLGYMVDKYKTSGRIILSKIALALSVIINLSLLVFFKYADFIIVNLNNIFNASITQFRLPLPIGISFYTFQTMSYTIDIYRGEARRQNSIIDFGTYVAFFPQLIAGPIVRYNTIAEELDSRQETIQGFAHGISRFVIGLGKKVLLANNIGYLWQIISEIPIDKLSVINAWLGIIAFTFQIYFDFSGYSDMAIGLGRMFGFTFPENFNYPYMSTSISEFWRRWHISLGTWFKEYVYIPLGGNRKGRVCHIRNILIVWLLTGIWHGASWNFVFWGLYFGIIIILEKLFLLRWLSRLPQILRHIYALLMIIIGWTIFAFDSLAYALHYIGIMFGVQGKNILDTSSMYLLSSYGLMLIILVFASTCIPKKIYERLKKRKSLPHWITYAAEALAIVAVVLISVAYLVDASYNPFLYFRF